MHDLTQLGSRLPRATLLGGLLMAAGCGLIDPDEGVDEARVEVEGASSVVLDLVTSDDFRVTFNSETQEQSVDLNSADTSALASLPFDRRYDISANERFFVRLINPDSVTAVTVAMRVSVDGRELYNSSGAIRGDTLLEFIYRLDES